MGYKTVIFDIDGTLCDPGPSIIESAQFALKEMGIDESDDARLRRFVGPPLEHAFKDYYDFDDDKAKRAVELFRQKLRSDGIKLYTPYPGIIELLGILKQSGKTIAVATSKVDIIAREALEATGMLDFFSYIGAEESGVAVKKQVTLQRVIEQLAGSDNLSSIAMIGDRKHDVEAASADGVDSIGVLWGYGTRDELSEAGATYTVNNTNELSQLLI